jgi:hypothetical protein
MPHLLRCFCQAKIVAFAQQGRCKAVGEPRPASVKQANSHDPAVNAADLKRVRY